MKRSEAQLCIKRYERFIYQKKCYEKLENKEKEIFLFGLER